MKKKIIVLTTNNNGFHREYDSEIEPQIGDCVVISDKQMFVVNKRLLTMLANKIVCIGEIVDFCI